MREIRTYGLKLITVAAAALSAMAATGKDGSPTGNVVRRLVDAPAMRDGFGEPVDYVNPFVGTAARGDTYPGPVWPLGMVQPGPDTGDRYWSCCQGYNFAHTSVMGFSQTHLSGTGCPDFQDVALLPFTGNVSAEIKAYKAWASVECRKAFANKKGVPRKAVIRGRMDKRTETAEPGYYAVTLTNWGVRVELTCSPRVAYHRYTFERGKDAHIYVNLQSGPQGWWKNPPPDRMGEHRSAWDAENGLLSGYSCITAWAVNRDLSFAVQFSPRPKAARRLEPLDGWKGDRWVLDFDLPDGGAVIAKAAVSSVDESGAKANLFADDGFDFDARRAACRAAWNKFLSFAEIEASADKKAQFYTALYHAYVQPNMLSDVDGRYRDDARKVVKADGFTVYSTFSTWDTVRAAHPLNDKACSWEALGRLIPEMQAAGLLGHLFVCPDLIYGGLLGSFKPCVPIDQVLFVRSTQVHALSPMMQFSASPRRVLDDAHFALVKEAVELRKKFVPRILALARESAKSGEPMLRSMEYAFPGNGYASVKGQFVLGGDMVVAPQTVKGARTRTVLLPTGRWRADDGAVFDGPCRIDVKSPLSRLPYFLSGAK